MELTIAAGLASSALLFSNLASILLAASRLKRRHVIAPPVGAQPVSIIVPSRGVEPFTQETLQRAFSLDWPRYELIFCVAHAEDPVVRLIDAAI
ncbi:MAG: ceramide glucosyltransferase, partial [Mesorhizobium sp.]